MIDEIAAKLELRPIEVVNIVEILLHHKKVANNDLVRYTGLAKASLQRLLKELSVFLEPPSRFCVLNQVGREKLVAEVGKYDRDTGKREIINLLSKHSSVRPIPDRNLDQFTATIQTSARRAILMAKKGDIYDRSIAILGDDDLNSVAIAVLGGAKKIIVFEKDPRLVSLVRKISEDNNLKIEMIEHDLFKAFPDKYLESFDTVFSDPPYAPGGISLFLNRGIQLMKRSLLSRFYLCYGNSDRARERELEIQQIINNKGLLIKTKINQFNYYHGADSIGSRSSLYLLDWTNNVKATKLIEKKIYTNE